MRFTTMLGAALTLAVLPASGADQYVPPKRPPCETTAPPAGPEFVRLDVGASPWYSKHYAAADEPPLRATGHPSAEVYRFLLLPSFDKPQLLRLERRDDMASLTYKRLSGTGGYNPGEIQSSSTVPIDPSTWKSLRRQIEASGFWKLTSRAALRDYRAAVARANCKGRIGGATDGTILVVEGATQDSWHAVDRRHADDVLSPIWEHLVELHSR